ncbi:MAG: radical SAM protein [Vicinamibacterales bacterium]
MAEAEPYPASHQGRDQFVLARRGPRPVHDPWQHQGLIVEDERTADGGVARVATVLLTGRECPWRCVMCDLWRYTTDTDTPLGAIPAQIAAARASLRDQPVPVTGMKLYNAGSFFDPRAVPDADYDRVADAVTGLSRVVVESHPALVGPRVERFLAALGRADHSGPAPQLEVAMGLETAHPDALDRLHKRFTLDQFRRAADALARLGVGLRLFLLVAPPFVPVADQDAWLMHSIEVAISCGATVVSLVPTRHGTGAMEALIELDMFRAPTLEDIERSLALALAHTPASTRVFVDLWDLERFATCPHCLAARRTRLHTMNLEQRVLPVVTCLGCEDRAPA